MEAMASGLPVVSTSKGCEGLDLKTGDGIIIVDDPVEFANTVIDFLSDSTKREVLRHRGFAISKERFDWERCLEPLDEIYSVAKLVRQAPSV